MQVLQLFRNGSAEEYIVLGTAYVQDVTITAMQAHTWFLCPAFDNVHKHQKQGYKEKDQAIYHYTHMAYSNDEWWQKGVVDSNSARGAAQVRYGVLANTSIWSEINTNME